MEKNNRPSAVLYVVQTSMCRWAMQLFLARFRHIQLVDTLRDGFGRGSAAVEGDQCCRPGSSGRCPLHWYLEQMFFSLGLGLFCFSNTFVCFAQNSLGAAFIKKQFSDCICSCFRAEWSFKKIIRDAGFGVYVG